MKHRRAVIIWSIVIAGFALATALDRAAFHALRIADRERLESRDWYEMLRAVGYAPTWIIIGVLIILHDRGGDRRRLPFWDRHRRGVCVMLAAGLSGLLAEILKMVFGRERPIMHDGAYVFKPLFRGFVDASNLGLPSSHTAVAFGGAFMLGFFWPRTLWAALLLAAGCALTRMLSGAHFLTDVYLGAAVSYAVAWAIARRQPGAWPGGGAAAFGARA